MSFRDSLPSSIASLLALSLLTVPGAVAARQDSDPYRKWLREEVVYIITAQEAEVFAKLASAEEKLAFIEAFWRRRDPNPTTPVNEYRDEYHRRIAYANENFASGVPGWRTDRGLIYIKYGPPDFIERHPGGGDYQRPAWEGGGSTTTYPFERWEYRQIPGVGSDVEIEFVDDTLSGEYRLTTDPNAKDALLRTPNAGLTDAEMLGLVAQKIDRIVGKSAPMPGHSPLVAGQGRLRDQPFQKLMLVTDLYRAPAFEFPDLKARVSARTRYDDFPVRVRSDVFEAGEGGRVLLTLYVEEKDLVAENPGDPVDVRVFAAITDLTGRIAREFEDTLLARSGGTGGRLAYQRDVFLPPGRYKLSIYLQLSASDRMGAAEGLIVVPGGSEELRLSSIMAAQCIEAVENDVGMSFKVWPVLDGQVPNSSGKLGFYYEIYGHGIDQSSGRPDLEIRYEVYAQSEDPIHLRPTYHSAEPVQGRIRVLSVLDATSLKKGPHRLRIRLNDRVGRREMSHSLRFVFE